MSFLERIQRCIPLLASSSAGGFSTAGVICESTTRQISFQIQKLFKQSASSRRGLLLKSLVKSTATSRTATQGEIKEDCAANLRTNPALRGCRRYLDELAQRFMVDPIDGKL